MKKKELVRFSRGYLFNFFLFSKIPTSFHDNDIQRSVQHDDAGHLELFRVLFHFEFVSGVHQGFDSKIVTFKDFPSEFLRFDFFLKNNILFSRVYFLISEKSHHFSISTLRYLISSNTLNHTITDL